MRKLIRLELKRFELKPHLIGLITANIVILFLSSFMSMLLTTDANVSPPTGLPEINLDTTTLAVILVRATLIIWEAILISSFIIEEYRNKTIGLLFTYPVNRAKLILAKVVVICGIILGFHVFSVFFQHISILLLSNQFDFVTYSIENPIIQVITAISTILLGLLPLCIGMVKKSSIATIVSSIIIVAIASNSQGSSAGLLSVPIVAVVLGIIGVISSTFAIRRMITSDLNN